MTPNTSALQHDPEWLELIELLRERKPLLVEDFKARFDGNVIYSGKVSREELDALVASTMEMYLILLSGQPLDSELQQLPADLGRRRARQGVPAEQLLEGVRTNSRVIWNALRQIASSEAAACLVRNTDAVLSLVEWHVREVQRSYLREQEALHRSSERRRQRAIARIFDSQRPDREELLVLSSELGIPCDGRFDVVVHLGPHDAHCGLCGRFGRGMFVHEMPGGTCHFRVAGDDDLLAELQGVRAAVLRQIRGTGRIQEANLAGLSIVRTRTGLAPEPVTIGDAWPAVAWKALCDALPADLLPVDLAALRALHAETRNRLVETVTTYLATGSIKETADLLFCHRNTIVKRLAAFEDLVGIDLSIPRQSALAVLALAAPLAE
jgi:hypothetical protein